MALLQQHPQHLLLHSTKATPINIPVHHCERAEAIAVGTVAVASRSSHKGNVHHFATIAARYVERGLIAWTSTIADVLRCVSWWRPRVLSHRSGLDQKCPDAIWKVARSLHTKDLQATPTDRQQQRQKYIGALFSTGGNVVRSNPAHELGLLLLLLAEAEGGRVQVPVSKSSRSCWITRAQALPVL